MVREVVFTLKENVCSDMMIRFTPASRREGAMKNMIRKHSSLLVIAVVFGLLGAGSVDVKAEPEEQEEFIEAVESFYERYKDAPNDLKRSSLRVKRRKAISKILPSRNVSEWEGTLVSMGTNRDGKAYISIKLKGAESIEVGTHNNAFSDIGHNTVK